MTKTLEAGDIYNLSADKRLVFLGGNKGRLEIKVYADRPWELAQNNITIPPAALTKWLSLKTDEAQ